MKTQKVNDELWIRIKKINLTYPLRATVIKDGFTLKRAEEAANEYRKFLYITQVSSGLSPTPDVDKIWHYHCLDMLKYQKDCLMTFGKIIYHKPDPITDSQLIKAIRSNSLKSHGNFITDGNEIMLSDCGEEKCTGCNDCEAESCQEKRWSSKRKLLVKDFKIGSDKNIQEFVKASTLTRFIDIKNSLVFV